MEELHNLLNQLYEIEKPYEVKFSHLNSLIKSLEKKIISLEKNILASNNILFSLTNDKIIKINDIYSAWETRLEEKFVESVKNQNITNFQNYPLNQRFLRLIKREITMISSFKSTQKALFIGSGPMPISAILIHDLLGIHIDCIDSNEKA